MKTVGRAKRIAGAIGLLAALSLTASGCSAPAEDSTSPAAETGTSAPAPEAPVKTAPAAAEAPNKVANFDPSKIVVEHSYVEAFGYEQTEIDAISNDATKIVSVMFGEHPEYRVKGFVPTEEHWATVSAEMRPLVNDAAFAFMQENWTGKNLPALTTYREGHGADQTYTYTTAAGEACTDSPTVPYDAEMTSLSIGGMNSLGNVMAPKATAKFSATVTCEQGGTMKGVLGASFLMEKQGDKYLMAHGYTFEILEKFAMVK